MHIMKGLLLGAACVTATAAFAAEITKARYSIESRIWISSPPASVWAVLTDTASYPTWNPSIQRLSGELRTGGRIEVDIGAPGDTMTFKPVLLDVTPEKTLRWLGRVWPGGLFDGEHSFTLTPRDGGTDFVQSERFSGLFVGWFTKGVIVKTQDGFRQMNEALKHRVEARGQG